MFRTMSNTSLTLLFAETKKSWLQALHHFCTESTQGTNELADEVLTWQDKEEDA